MDSSVWTLLDIIFIGAGLYAFYAFYLMKTKNEVKTNILLSNDVDIKKCKDLKGYISFIAPRTVIFAASCTIYGVTGIINSYVVEVPSVLYTALMIILFIIIVWFAFQTKKSVKLFW